MGDIVVEVEQGKLRGKTLKDVKDGTIYSFQGIPFAKPPVGELRFKDPVPPDHWSGIRDATAEGSECYARHMMILESMVGSEDCLILNVYTPALPKDSCAQLKPVLVWIHGGGFVHGSSKTELYGPEYLVAEDVVLVTINYRLGVLGFLSLEDQSLGVPGNAALKDIVMALKWVQKNVKQFCGDPDNVTVFGESAGGSAVHYLILSPLAKGLFHKAISQSGTSLNRWARGRRDVAKELSRLLELPYHSDKEFLKEVQQLPIEKVYELAEKVPDVFHDESAIRPYGPIIEKPGPNAFITEEPIEILKSGKFNQVPLIIGYNSNEGLLLDFMSRISKPNPESLTNFETKVPFMLGLNKGTSKSKEVASKIKSFYFEELKSNGDENIYKLATDYFFFRDIIFTAKHHAVQSSKSVYLYRMSVDANLNLFKRSFGISKPGTCHADDIGYLFKTTVLPHVVKSGSLEDKTIQRFTKLWTNFAKYGDPNPKKTDKLINVHWMPVEKSSANFLDIGEELTVGVNPESERTQFWEKIFSDINPLYRYDS